MRFLRGSDPSLLWRGVTISHLPAFANLSPPVLE
jgi:hypothetical protein